MQTLLRKCEVDSRCFRGEETRIIGKDGKQVIDHLISGLLRGHQSLAQTGSNKTTPLAFNPCATVLKEYTDLNLFLLFFTLFVSLVDNMLIREIICCTEKPQRHKDKHKLTNSSLS